MLVAFLYGSMIWGIFPLDEGISWEGHLTGMVACIILAFYYKQHGPPPNFGKWKYEDAEDDTEFYEEEYWNIDDENIEKQ